LSTSSCSHIACQPIAFDTDSGVSEIDATIALAKYTNTRLTISDILNIDLVRPIDPNRYSGFDDLVIPTHYKELLVALVDNHTSGLQRRKEKQKKSLAKLGGGQIDLVHGKGQGLIILLHGPPGSGKTSTAETIAAHTQRPLYSITCGDIGLSPTIVETQLGEHTARADKWGCVLLLDEADVFLMQRSWREVDRNALVSVFLRQLEYYSGILFLTTNRPGTIDEAFKSRIHLSLRYPSIDLSSTRQMWDNIMRRLEAENARAEVRVEFDRRGLLAFAEQHYKRRQQASSGSTWNGRQIRNAFQTALALGHADRHAALAAAGKTPEWAVTSGRKRWTTVKLTAKNFRRIARATTEFEDYIIALRGKDSDAAREAEVRDDDYDPDMPPARKNYRPSLTKVAGGWSSREHAAANVPGTSGRQGQTTRQRSRRESDSDDDEDEEDDDDDEEEEEEEEDNDEGEDDG
jgi:SpoVK/Ycf46/Vps4 family AAA+-type ATPase